jgi:hypothetical protein
MICNKVYELLMSILMNDINPQSVRISNNLWAQTPNQNWYRRYKNVIVSQMRVGKQEFTELIGNWHAYSKNSKF